MKKKQIILCMIGTFYILTAAAGIGYVSSFFSRIHKSAASGEARTEEETSLIPGSETDAGLTPEASADDSAAASPALPETESGTEAEETERTEAAQELSPGSAQGVPFVSVSSSNVNIRSGPGPWAGIIGSIRPGTGGTILEFTDDGWALVSYEGVEGYSACRCLDYQAP